jgi:hypothetical protein
METRIGWDLALAALLLAFALSMVVSWVYVSTYRGLSYVRSFANTLAIAGVVSAIVMLAIGDDVARGIGLVGALTVIRFRTNLKDTRDLMFAFATLSIGVACGVLAFTVAIMGTLVFCLAMAYLSFSDYGSRRLYNAVLRVQVPVTPEEQRSLGKVIGEFAPSFVLVSMRDLGGGTQEHAYHLKLRNVKEKGQLLKSVSAISGVSGATLLMQDTSIEP